MSRRPVVLLAYHYPPSGSVGAIRAAAVAQALREAGHPVTVIRAGAPGDGPTRSPEGIAVETVVPAPSPRERVARLRTSIRSPQAAAPGATDDAAQRWRPPERIPTWKRAVQSLLWLPDDQQGFIRVAATAAVRAIRAAGPRPILYSTSPPHSAQVAALLAHWLTGATWVMELRDPWTGNPGKAWFNRTSLTDAVERRLEAWCLRGASLVVGVSEGICRTVEPLARRTDTGVSLIRNGIEALEPAGALPERGPLRVLHAGSCYLGRDPRPFLGALAAVVRRRGLTAAELQVEFLGDCEWFDGESIREAAKRLGLAAIVGFTARVSPAEARDRIRSADVLLLLAERQPAQVPQKLYEYLGSGRRMLVFADPGGETAHMTAAVGGHVLTHAAAPDLDAAVEEAVTRRTRAVVDEALLQEWTTARQMERLVAAIGALGE